MSLLTLEKFQEEDIIKIIEHAMAFKNGKITRNYQGTSVVTLFFEPSTRTQYSFEIAASQLGCNVVSVNTTNSSVKKGETLYDTVKTFEAMGVKAVVIRDVKRGYYEELTNINIPILNGGDGDGDHPTQVLLDLMTIYEAYQKFAGLNVVICGDIKHSRVARTNYNTMNKLGINVKLVAPSHLQADYGTYHHLDDAIEGADVVMMLRMQNERHDHHLDLDNEYQLNMKRVSKLKDSAIIMHPGPFNRGVEIADDVIECEKSRILTQVTNGVYIRMAVLDNELR